MGPPLATSQQDYLEKSSKLLTRHTIPVPMVANQTQTRQPLLQQNNMASIGLQNLTQATMPNEQQKQQYQPQRTTPEALSICVLFGASLDSTVQMGNANGADWQEVVYQKIKSMKEMYLPALIDLYQELASKAQQ
ncbi:hypothetical protein K7X08_022163 [Anisodus acutangulus]|uniref:Uncharacterized protein n=1 Tax=Anisodus acutangulus TaxID=402998 RepID=A0A9Q1L4A2_9SOLA|nr:hypothetical protein K7X08_022163 [Anisodus acutangulus]